MHQVNPALTVGYQEQWLPSGKVGHLLIMERHLLTINHESNLGTAQQKQTKLFWASFQMLLPHSFITQFGVISLFCTLEATLDQQPYARH